MSPRGRVLDVVGILVCAVVFVAVARSWSQSYIVNYEFWPGATAGVGLERLTQPELHPLGQSLRRLSLGRSALLPHRRKLLRLCVAAGARCLLRHANDLLRPRPVPRVRRQQLRRLRLRVPRLERMSVRVPNSRRWRVALGVASAVGAAAALFSAFATAHEPRDADRGGLSAGVSAVDALPAVNSLPPDVASGSSKAPATSAPIQLGRRPACEGYGLVSALAAAICTPTRRTTGRSVST